MLITSGSSRVKECYHWYLCAANMPRPRSVSITMKSLWWDIFILIKKNCLRINYFISRFNRFIPKLNFSTHEIMPSSQEIKILVQSPFSSK